MAGDKGGESFLGSRDGRALKVQIQRVSKAAKGW